MTRLSKAKPHGGERGVEIARAKGKSNSSAASASEISVDKPLTDMQKLFVQHWAKGDSITSATLRAGYADDGVGYRLVRQPNILAYKAKFEVKYEAAAQMTREKVMGMIMEGYEMAKLMSEPASMIAAAREAGKMCGYYAPVETRIKLDVSGNIIMKDLNTMTDAELLEVMAKGAAPLLLADTSEDAE